MKKIMTLLLVVALSLPVCAQYDSNRKRSRYNHNDTERYYGLRLGLNIATLSSDAAMYDMNSRTGLAFGFVYGFQLANAAPIWLETGLLYSEKGGESKWLDPTTNKDQKVTCSLNYLQLPVVCKYAFEVADDFFLQPFFGGYLSLGIAGKIKEYDTKESYSSYDSFGRFDGGLRVGCGVEYQMVYLEMGFDFGLANINKDDFDTAHTQNFFITAGVNF